MHQIGMAKVILNLLKSVIVLCLIAIRTSGDVNYCDIICGNNIKHTMCEYPAGGGDACKNNVKVKLREKEKRWILEFHNNLRERVAQGKEIRGDPGPLPSASNMMKLVWDGELGMIAQRWADQCNSPLHDSCRTTRNGTVLGQNSYIGSFKPKDSPSGTSEEIFKNIQRAVISWRNEVDNMDYNNVDSFKPESVKKVGNFTQMIWGYTVYIGCGFTEFSLADGYLEFRLICNYGPIGNNPSYPIYAVGKPCTDCPSEFYQCSLTWHGLCWNGEMHEFTDEIPPPDGGGAISQKSFLATWFYSLVVCYVHKTVLVCIYS